MLRATRTQSFDTVNVLRAVICLGILLKHFLVPSPYAQFWPFILPWLNWIPGTECFLVVAGYLLAHTFRRNDSQYLSVSRYVQRRLYRIVAPYWVALALAYLLPLGRVALGGSLSSEVFQPLSVLLNFLCVQDVFGYPSPLPYFWTMATIIQCYAGWATLFWIVRATVHRNGVSDWQVRTTQVLQVFCFTVGFLAGVSTWGGYVGAGGWELVRWVQYVALGAVAYWAHQGQIHWLLTIPLVALGMWGFWASGSTRPLFGTTTAALLVAVPNLKCGSGLVFRFAHGLGERSFSVYLMHGLVGHRISGLCVRLGLGPENATLAVLGVVMSIVGSILAGCVLYWLVEVPMAKRASRVEYRK